MVHEHKKALRDLNGLTLGDDYDKFLEVDGEYFDSIEARIDLLRSESDINDVSNNSIADIEEEYGVVPNIGDSLATRIKNVKSRRKMQGALNIQTYVEIAASQDITISIDQAVGFILDLDLLDIDPMFSDDQEFSYIVTLSEQHRFPFLLDSSFLDIDPMVGFDRNNSVEELLEKFKPAHRSIIWQYFNFGFETGDFTAWRVFEDVIDSVTVRTGTFSAKLVAAGSEIFGVQSLPMQIPLNRLIQIDSWHNVTAYTSGVYAFEIRFYSDHNGLDLDTTEFIFFKISTTTGWEQGIKTIGPEHLSPDFIIPDVARSFRVSRFWSLTPVGTAFIDDVSISYL